VLSSSRPSCPRPPSGCASPRTRRGPPSPASTVRGGERSRPEREWVSPSASSRVESRSA
jgi:hypothetical protein